MKFKDLLTENNLKDVPFDHVHAEVHTFLKSQGWDKEGVGVGEIKWQAPWDTPPVNDPRHMDLDAHLKSVGFIKDHISGSGWHYYDHHNGCKVSYHDSGMLVLRRMEAK
jgi:hypothetical protein